MTRYSTVIRASTSSCEENMGNMGFFKVKIWDKYGIFNGIFIKIWDKYGTNTSSLQSQIFAATWIRGCVIIFTHFRHQNFMNFNYKIFRMNFMDCISTNFTKSLNSLIFLALFFQQCHDGMKDFCGWQSFLQNMGNMGQFVENMGQNMGNMGNMVNMVNMGPVDALFKPIRWSITSLIYFPLN